MTTPPDPVELPIRIRAVPIDGRFKGRTVFLRAEEFYYAFLGSKAMSCVRTQWVRRYTYSDRTVYARVRTWGVVRVPGASLKRLHAWLGNSFVQIEQGVLVSIDAVVSIDDQRAGAGGIVGVLVSAPEGGPVVEELVASRKGRRELLRRLSSRAPASSGGRRRERESAGS
jgi:hypothetical protein